MRARVTALLAVTLVLSGCVAVPPPSPSQQQREAQRADVLALTWASTGLAGDPPVVVAQDWMTEMDWVQAIGQCLADSGIPDSSWSYGSEGGFVLSTPDGLEVDDPHAQRAFYVCVAGNNLPPDSDQALTDAQLDYIYDYYETWLVPCVIMQGYHFSDVPTRTEFKALGGQWRPFYSVDIRINGTAYEELERLCGAERPRLY